MSRFSVLPKIYPLPCPKNHPSLSHGNTQIDCGQSSPDVSRHVIIPFSIMNKKAVAIGDQPGKERFEVAANVRIGIFLNQERSGSVPKMKRQQSCLYRLPRQPSL